jgi:hypothetical protein
MLASLEFAMHRPIASLALGIGAKGAIDKRGRQWELYFGGRLAAARSLRSASAVRRGP